jgi:hypothetical protein
MGTRLQCTEQQCNVVTHVGRLGGSNDHSSHFKNGSDITNG